jgi:hypothetical protein
VYVDGLRKTTKNLMTVGVSAKIRTALHPNATVYMEIRKVSE